MREYVLNVIVGSNCSLEGYTNGNWLYSAILLYYILALESESCGTNTKRLHLIKI